MQLRRIAGPALLAAVEPATFGYNAEDSTGAYTVKLQLDGQRDNS